MPGCPKTDQTCFELLPKGGSICCLSQYVCNILLAINVPDFSNLSSYCFPHSMIAIALCFFFDVLDGKVVMSMAPLLWQFPSCWCPQEVSVSRMAGNVGSPPPWPWSHWDWCVSWCSGWRIIGLWRFLQEECLLAPSSVDQKMLLTVNALFRHLEPKIYRCVDDCI